jgi:hypothetical protein
MLTKKITLGGGINEKLINSSIRGRCFLLSAIIFFISCHSQNISIISLPLLTEIDTLKQNGRIVTYRSDYFMIEGSPSPPINNAIANYVHKNFDSSHLQYDQYNMYFYKKSEFVNEETIRRLHPNSRYKALLNDKPVKQYVWYNGKQFAY